MKELTVLLLCIIVVFIYMNYIRKSLYLDKIESSVNGKKYYVRNLADKSEAADKLSNIGISLQNLIDSLDEKDEDKGEDILRLKKNFNSDYITPFKEILFIMFNFVKSILILIFSITWRGNLRCDVIVQTPNK